jgi:dihydrofolate reductase
MTPCQTGPCAEEALMAHTVLFMSMSLDGFIAGPDDDHSRPSGIDGERLFAWAESEQYADEARHRLAEYDDTGAVLAGRRTYDFVDGWRGNHHGVPVVIVTHAAPTRVPEGPSSFTFVTEGISRAVAVAKEAAGDKDVLVHGAEVAQQCLRAGLLDEIQLHLVPVLLGEGRRLFDHLGKDHIELEIVRVIDTPVATHLRYRVLR